MVAVWAMSFPTPTGEYLTTASEILETIMVPAWEVPTEAKTMALAQAITAATEADPSATICMATHPAITVAMDQWAAAPMAQVKVVPVVVPPTIQTEE